MNQLVVQKKTLEKVLKVLINPSKYTLKHRIFHNNDKNSAAKCLQVNEDFIEVLYDSTKNTEYRSLVNIIMMTEEEKSELNLPKHLLPVDCKNLEYCGGGAVIRYSSVELKKFVHEKSEEIKKMKLLKEE
eukprot:gene2496-3202_t